MNTLLFIFVTLGLAVVRLRMGQGFPDFLVAWLVVLSYYGEGSRGAVQASWIGLLHGFPSHSRLEAVMALGMFLILRSQRFHMGRDGWIPRTLGVTLACLLFCLPELIRSDPSGWRQHARLLATYGFVTGILSWPLFALGRRWGKPLGLRAQP